MSFCISTMYLFQQCLKLSSDLSSVKSKVIIIEDLNKNSNILLIKFTFILHLHTVFQQVQSHLFIFIQARETSES